MAQSSIQGISVTVRLNAGTVEGKIQYVNSSLGAKLSTTTYDDDKALVIANLLEPCLAYPVAEVQKNVKSVISASE